MMLARFILGIVFILASIEKIPQPELFALNIEAYKIIPLFLVNIAALVIPWVELICGIFLIAGINTRSSSFMLSLLSIIFILLIISALARGLKIDCGCFGSENSSPVSWIRVLEDIGLLILGIYIFIFSESRTATPKTSSDH